MFASKKKRAKELKEKEVIIGSDDDEFLNFLLFFVSLDIF
jgi:hypothetical protein